jgi:hypothetical protein
MRWPPEQISRTLAGWTVFSFLLLAPISGLLVEHYLSRRAPPGTRVFFPIRILLFLIGCVPWLGLLAIPMWKRLTARAPGWALRPASTRLDLDAPETNLPRRSPLHFVYTSGAFGIWLIVTGLLLPIAGCFWLAAREDRKSILIVCIALHLAQALCMTVHAESEPLFTDQSRRSLHLLPWLCLLPQPVPAVALFLSFWPVAEGSRGKTLTWSAYARRNGVGHLSRWLDLRLALQQHWSGSSWREKWTLPRGLEIPSPEGRSEEIRRTWMRTKAYLLVIESSLVAGLIVRFTSERALRPWLLTACALASLGLLHATAGTLCRLLHIRPPRVLNPPAAGLYLFITQTASVFGILAGPLAAQRRFSELALFTAVSAALTAMLSVLVMLSRQFTSQSLTLVTWVTWPLSFLFLIVPPLVLALRPELARTVFGLAMLVPVMDVVVGMWCLPWLLRPFRWREGVTVLRGLTALVALLPLGGLALPAWLFSLAHHPAHRLPSPPCPSSAGSS